MTASPVTSDALALSDKIMRLAMDAALATAEGDSARAANCLLEHDRFTRQLARIAERLDGCIA